MKTFSDNIITPEMMYASIREAFNAQNVFFEHSVKKQTKTIKIMLASSIVINVIAVVAVVSNYL